jgi:hypothetical protein
VYHFFPSVRYHLNLSIMLLISVELCLMLHSRAFNCGCLFYFELCFLIFISIYNHLAAYQQYFEPFVPLQLRRERIAERMRALQELVPNTNKVIMLLY